MANLLFEMSKGLGPHDAHLHLDTAGWLRTWTPYQSEAADAAARYFARHCEWPNLDPEPACQLYFRCLFAIEHCIEAHSSQPDYPKTTEAEQQAFEKLLIDSWHLVGIEWAERRYGSPHALGTRGWA